MGSNYYFFFRFIYVQVKGYISDGEWGMVEGKGEHILLSFLIRLH